LLVSVPIIVSALSKNIFLALPAFLIYEISRGIEKPAQLAYLNKFAEQKMRATVLSFESMMASLGAAVGLILFGLLAKNTSIETSWIAAGIFALFLIPIFLRAKANSKQR
jgi:MFS family permease